MSKMKAALLSGLLLCMQFLWAQNQVTGKVTDARDGSPLSGVTVTVRNSNQTTVTGTDGSFSLNAPAGSRLVFSYVGYQSIEQAAAGTVNVGLSPGNNQLNEVVVVGYGSRSKRDITGSVTKVAARDITNTPATSFESAIQGRAAGVQVQQQNGKLGQGINIRIRGGSSVSAGNEPLYVVDGVPVISGSLSSNGAATNALADLNMNDIESVEILKDASAAAIYGSRASNGVVLITTKKGRSGQSKIEFGFFSGVQSPTGRREFLNAQQYVDFFKQAAIGAAKQDFNAGYYNTLQDAIDDYTSYVESRFTRYAGGDTTWKTGSVNTDWEDQVFRTAPISQYDLNLSGGTDKTKFYASGQYLDQKGILIGNSYKRYSGRLNLDHQVRNWLSIGMNMSFARSQNNRLSNDDQFSTPLQIVALSPITPLIDPRTGLLSGSLDTATGKPNTNYPVYYNPLLSVENAFYKTLVNRTLGNVYGNVNIVKGLTFRSELGVDQLNQNEEGYYGSITARNTGVSHGNGFYTTDQVLNLNTNNYFHYNTSFSDVHDLDVVAGMSFQKQTDISSYSEAEDFPSDAYKKLVSGTTKKAANTGSTEFTFLSYFLRANYKYNDKYLLALSGRYDGSSRFGANNRYGFFPAASVGWIVTKENFMQNVHFLNFLKLKASYGLTGNAEIPDFGARGLYAAAAYGAASGQIPTQLGNPNLKWETTEGVDLGLEASVLKNRISIEFDVYKRYTRDLLLSQEVPGTSGFSTRLANVGNLTNRGIEVTINTTNIATSSFRWTSSLNFSANRNKITNLGGQVLGGDQNKAMEGQPLGVFFAREFAGADPQNGDALYYKNTLKGDGTRDRTTTNNYNEAQDVVIGNPNPDFIYGFSNTLSYKGIDLDVLLQGVSGNQIYNGGGQYMSASGSNGFDNQTVDQLRAWKNPGDITDVPEARLFYANGTDPSSRYISDGSYLRVKSATLGYNLPAAMISRLKIDRLRVYVRAQNLFTITNYKGWDPEVNADYQANNINQGVDFYSAPQFKTIVFGLNLGL